MTIFSPAQLKSWLRYDADDAFVEATATQVELVVAGWLSAEVGTIPVQVEQTSPLYAWALELGGIAYENPTSMTSDAAGETTSTWSDRRLQILAAARRWATEQGVATTRPTAPVGAFPPARPWPEGRGW